MKWEPIEGEKQCAACREFKELPEFSASKRARREAKCRECAMQSAPRKWTDDDDAVLLEVYETEGTPAVMKLLPHRTKRAIWRRAGEMGLKSPLNLAGPEWHGEWRMPVQETADVQRLWQSVDMAMGGDRRMAA